MNSKLRSTFIFLAVVLLLIGIFFRVINIDKKIYWYDEAATSLRIAGYTESEFSQAIFNEELITIGELQKYQQVNSEKNLFDTVNSLIIDEPQHPPLYFILVRLWAELFGSEIASIRSLSVLCSLIMFPCIYWLCLELFDSVLVGYLAMALIAVSPFFLYFAQEARPYSLWALIIVVSNIALLRAIRTKTNFNWLLYAISLSIAFYTHLFSLLVAIGQGIYVIATQRISKSKILFQYLLALVVVILTFLPWLLVLIASFNRVEEQTSWMNSMVIAWWQLIGLLLISISQIFLDIPSNLTWRQIPLYYNFLDFGLIALCLPIFILILYSFYFLYQREKRSFLFILLLINSIVFPLLVKDLVSGSISSASSRYLTPTFIGILLAISYLLTTKLFEARATHSLIWKTLTIILTLYGVLSCTLIARSSVSSYHVQSQDNLPIASYINRTQRPLLIYDPYYSENVYNWHKHAKVYQILSMMHVLKPTVEFKVLDISQFNPEKYADFSDILALFPSILTQSTSDNLRQLDKMQKFLHEVTKDRELKIETVYSGSKRPTLRTSFLIKFEQN